MSEQRVGHDGKAWPETFDGKVWAEEFSARFPSVQVDDALAWFCNAIMRGYDEANWRRERQQPQKLWLWKNFVNGRPEYWAFDNAFPVHMDCGDPQTLGEPCGYAIVKPSRQGRTDVSEAEVLRRIAASRP